MAAESPRRWLLPGLGPGSVVAGHRVESRIGAGGMAVVLLARDESLGRLVALKVLAPGFADDPEFRQRFIRESRAAAAVDHPHIIPVYAAGEADGVLYIAMRYVPGGDLRALLHREGPLPSARVGHLLRPVASALDAGHAAGLVHRDVKPANVLIDSGPGRSEHPYLSDFGLAKGSASTGLTGAGQFLGTLEYCAPEQITGKRAGPQTDQYALACVAFTMLTGTVPFPREEATAILWAHMSEPPPAVTALRRDLSPTVDDVLAKALAKTPTDRYATCGEFIAALRAAFGMPAVPDDSVPPDPVHGVVPPSPLSVPPRPAAAQSDELTGPTEDVTVLRTADGAARSADPAAEVTGAHRVVKAPQHLGRRRSSVIVAAAVAVAGGATAAALLTLQPASQHDGPLATLVEPSGGQYVGVAFSSNSTLVTSDNQNHAYTWNIAVSHPTPTATDFNAAGALMTAQSVVSPDGKLSVGVSIQAREIQLRDTATAVVVRTFSLPAGSSVSDLGFSPDGTKLAAGCSNGVIYVWRTAG